MKNVLLSIHSKKMTGDEFYVEFWKSQQQVNSKIWPPYDSEVIIAAATALAQWFSSHTLKSSAVPCSTMIFGRRPLVAAAPGKGSGVLV